MGWLRIHDGFTANSKIAQLTDGEFRVWMRLLCHCANSRDPSVDAVARREVSGLSTTRIRRFANLYLLDAVGDDFEVHDWPKYMPKEEQNAARQARWRARRRNERGNASRNAESNEEVDEKVTASPSRAGAGTRGSPSRPVPKEQLPPPPPVASNARKNGSGGADQEFGETIDLEHAFATTLKDIP